jgi:hypothetical protein
VDGHNCYFPNAYFDQGQPIGFDGKHETIQTKLLFADILADATKSKEIMCDSYTSTPSNIQIQPQPPADPEFAVPFDVLQSA